MNATVSPASGGSQLALPITEVDRQYHAWIKMYFDLFDFGTISFGSLMRPTDLQLERHRNAGSDWGRRLQPLPLHRVASHRAWHETLCLTPKRNAVGRRPFTVICYMIPFNGDSKLAKRVLDTFNSEYYDGLLYAEREGNAYFCYAAYRLPGRLRPIDRRSRFLSTAKANVLKQKLDRALERLCAQRGWATQIHAFGSFTQTSKVDGIVRLRADLRGQPMRAPRCPDKASAFRLLLSLFSSKVIPRIIASVTPGCPIVTLPSSRCSSAEASARNAEQAIMLDCLIWAACQIFHGVLPRHDLREPQLDEILALATQRSQDQHGLILNRHLLLEIRELLSRLLAIGKAIGSQYHKLWFDVDEFDVGEEIVIRAGVELSRVAQLNQNPKLRHCRISHRVLAITLCTIAKNCITKHGFVPTKSVKKMLQHHKHASNGSQVKILMDELRNVGLIQRLGNYKPGSHSWRYRLADAVYALPFIADRKPAPPQVQAVSNSSAGGMFAMTMPSAEEANEAEADTLCISMKFDLSIEEELEALHPDIVGHLEVPDDSSGYGT